MISAGVQTGSLTNDIRPIPSRLHVSMYRHGWAPPFHPSDRSALGLASLRGTDSDSPRANRAAASIDYEQDYEHSASLEEPP